MLAFKSYTNLSPVDLVDNQHNLAWPVEDPLRARNSDVSLDRLLCLQIDGFAHDCFEFLEPPLHQSLGLKLSPTSRSKETECRQTMVTYWVDHARSWDFLAFFG